MNIPRSRAIEAVSMNVGSHQRGAGFSAYPQMMSVTSLKERSLSTRGARTAGSSISVPSPVTGSSSVCGGGLAMPARRWAVS